MTIRDRRAYFPFELGSRPTRPMQGYLFKLPVAFVELFRELDEVPHFEGDLPADAAADQGSGPVPSSAGERPEFVPKDEDVRSREARPWARDPSEVDRALSAHARVERLVAEEAAEEGWSARGYGQGDPVFDLLLERKGGTGPVVVVEVKSTTATNEEKQLRLALGQVLRYRHLLQVSGARVVGFIGVEREPRDASWMELCRDSGVWLVWPGVVGDALRRLT